MARVRLLHQITTPIRAMSHTCKTLHKVNLVILKEEGDTITMRLIIMVAVILATVGTRAEDLKKFGLDDESSISPKIEVEPKTGSKGQAQ